MMKGLVALIGSMGVIGIVLLVFAPLMLSIYGLILAFKASVILGVLVLIIEPTPFVLGLLAFFGHPEVAGKIAAWLGM